MPGLRFYLDENVDVRIADGLRRRGVGASTAHDAGMLGATDAAQLEDAQRAELAATGLGGRDEACGPLQGRHPPVSTWEGRVRAARDDPDGSGVSSFSG